MYTLPDQELEKGLDNMLHAYGGDMDTDDAPGPSQPQSAAAAGGAGRKKASRPSKKARAAARGAEPLALQALIHAGY